MEERRENIMGTQPINRLLPSMAFPIMLSMLVQALYNVVDSVFVSMVSENALTSVSLAFPVQNLMIAVSVGTAVASTRFCPAVWVKKTLKPPIKWRKTASSSPC